MATSHRSDLHGLLAINKPEGMVSKDVSRWLVKRFGRLKLGHVGTLDPGASGVLPILLGRATRLQDHLLGLPKTYEFDITFGSETDTLDKDGVVVKTGEFAHLTGAGLKEAIRGFLGDFDQTPPIFSAVKYKGKALYDYARGGTGDAVPLDDLKRRVRVTDFDLLGFSHTAAGATGAATVGSFRVTCSKGTYVRVLVKDVADKVGSCGTLTRLVRTRAAGVDLTSTVDLETVEARRDDIASLVTPVEGIDLGILRWTCPRDAVTAKLAAGQQVTVELAEYLGGAKGEDSQSVPTWSRPALLVSDGGRAFGMGTIRRTEAGRVAIQMKRGL